MSVRQKCLRTLLILGIVAAPLAGSLAHSTPATLPPGAPIPAICVQARNEMRSGYPATMIISQRFTFMDDPHKMMQDLQAHPFPPDNPHLQQVMVHCVQCLYYMNKNQFSNYILWGHP